MNKNWEGILQYTCITYLIVTSREWLPWILIPVVDASIFDINKLQRCWSRPTRSKLISLFLMTVSLADSLFHWAGELFACYTGNINWTYLKFVELYHSASIPLVLHHTQGKKEKKTHYSITRPVRNRNLDYAFLTNMKITFSENVWIWTWVS